MPKSTARSCVKRRKTPFGENIVSKLNNATTEILAPAGSAEQLTAAVNNGCDSVYLGVDCFNARMKAPNFTLDNLPHWIDYCHLHSVKVYVAINTSLKNDEFKTAVRLLCQVYKMYADGVILTDPALIEIAAQLPKPFDIVASTQLNVHDGWGARFLKKCGATTVVCARESNADEIAQIADSGINAECFIHGATCVSQSGQCLFSAMVGGNSGNRGLCAQPCRKLYSVNGGAKRYMLSARDLCGLTAAKQLAEIGVHTFKIEGRNRRAEYAGITSAIYKRLVKNNYIPQSDDHTCLAKMYNRAMSTLSYLNGDNSDIIYSETCNHIGVKAGIIDGNGQINSDIELHKGDGVKVFDVAVEVCGGTVLSNGRQGVRAEFSAPVHSGMTVNLTTDKMLCEQILQTKALLKVDAEFVAFPDSNAVLSLYCNGTEINYISDFVVPAAQNSVATSEEVVEQLQKTGNSYYTMRNIVVKIGNVFLAKSQINEMRRQALQMLTDAIIGDYNSQFVNRIDAPTADDLFAKNNSSVVNGKTKSDARNECVKPALAVICYNEDDLRSAQPCADILIYKHSEINYDVLSSAAQFGCFVDLPSFSDNDYIYKLFGQLQMGAVCHNLGQVEVMRALKSPYIAGSGLNIFNDCIARQFSDAATFVYSLELTFDEIDKFENKNGLIFTDGSITLMKTVHCPFKAAFGCSCNNCQAHRKLTYTDEMGNRFRFVRRRDSRCTFELLNGNKLSVAAKLNCAGRYMIDYDPSVVEHYVNLNKGFNDGYTETQPYTRGRLFAKVK